MSPRLLFPALLVATCLPLWAEEEEKEYQKEELKSPATSAEPSALAPGEKPAPGHSTMAEAFNEGPRQFAHLLPGCLATHFPVTTKSPEAQQFIDQGMTQLHGFWYFEAERSFRQAAYLDPDCALAYLGMALANINNERRAAGFMKEAVKRRAHGDAREGRWIDAWAAYFSGDKRNLRPRREAVVKALEELVLAYPADLEARAFLMLQLWENSTEGVPLPSRLAVAALAAPILAQWPMHPGVHHYLVHLWNKDGSDQQALPDAAVCGQSAPGIAHLWHMSGHTYSALRRYDDAAWQQEASARVDHAYMREARILPEQIHNYAHNNDWLVKNLGFVGRAHEALALAQNLVELPRLGPEKQAAWRLGRAQILDVCSTFELWEELTALEGTPYLSPDPNNARETARLRALGVAWYARGEAEKGAAKLAALEGLLTKAQADRSAAADHAEAEAKKAHKSNEETTKAVTNAQRGFAKRVSDLENAVAEVRLERDLAAGDPTAAKEEFAKLGDLSPLRMARWQIALGQYEPAEQTLRNAIKADDGQVLPYALLAQAQEAAGDLTGAAETFATLRQRSAPIDLAAPPFARLAPLAARLEFSADWRQPALAKTDTGIRPPLDSLGPFRWTPYLAPDFNLPDAEGHTVSLSAQRGKPTLVLFYLGAGCAGCIEQLNKFTPAFPNFVSAGIDVIAVSTEAAEGLKETFAKAKDGTGYPFRVVSDASLAAFRSYRAYDDFESMPLHGAFLIDGNGAVRWQNISYQPFAEPEWLLEEAKRLLSLPPMITAPVAVVTDR